MNENLKGFFRTGQVSLIVEAYKAFCQSNTSGFIKKAMEQKGIKESPKEFPEMEYELKFSISAHPPKDSKTKEPNIKEYLEAFEFPPTRNARYLKDDVNSIATGTNHFFGRGNDELLILIEKGGKLYLKEKSQPLPFSTGVPYEHLVVKRTEERYECKAVDAAKRTAQIALEGGSHQGSLTKEKGDAFLLDTLDGRIFSFTVTRAKREDGAIQRQLEIEYAGYIPGFPAFEKDSEPAIVSDLVDIAKHVAMLHQNIPIGNGWKMSVTPTTERKYDFVIGTTQMTSLPLETRLLEEVIR